MRVFYNRRLLVILSVLLLMVSFSSVAINSNLLNLLSQKQAEIFLMQGSAREEEITKPNFALYFPEEIKVKKGESFLLPLSLLAQSSVESLTAYVTFDPRILAVEKINPIDGDFHRYPDIFFDNEKGLFRFTAETDKGFAGNKAVAEIKFSPKSQGATKLYFSQNEQGQASHILQKGTNVIEAVGDGLVLVED